MCELRAALAETIRSNHVLARAALSATPRTYSVSQMLPQSLPSHSKLTRTGIGQPGS